MAKKILFLTCGHAKSLQSHQTLQPVDCSRQASLSMGFSGKYTGVICCAYFQGIFPTQGLNLHLLQSLALAGRFFTTSANWEAPNLGLSNLIFLILSSEVSSITGFLCLTPEIYTKFIDINTYRHIFISFFTHVSVKCNFTSFFIHISVKCNITLYSMIYDV